METIRPFLRFLLRNAVPKLRFIHTLPNERRKTIQSSLTYAFSRRRQSTSTTSTSSSSTHDSVSKILLRHFLFQIHPDYFVQHKTEQAVNTQNYGSLQDVHSLLLRGEVPSPGVRTLVFYTKPSDFDPIPRRVKVFIGSLQRLEESMFDILDTAGASLPPDLRASISRRYSTTTSSSTSGGAAYGPTTGGSRSHHHAFMSGSGSCTPEQVSSFLDTLIDRKELMAWRADRARSLERSLAIVQSTFGVEAIDMRYSWSAQNNAVLLASLLRLVAPPEVYQRLECPWHGMTMVFSHDDCSEEPVDAIEAHVLVNPSHVPLQWLPIFERVTSPGLLATAQKSHIEIRRLVDMFDRAATVQLQRAVSQQLHQAMTKQQNSSAHHHDHAQVQGVSVCVRRGHTCSRKWFISFLSRLEGAMTRVINNNHTNNTTTTTSSDGVRTPASASGMTFRTVTTTNSNKDDRDVDDDDGLVGGKKLPPVLVISPSHLQDLGQGEVSEQGLELSDDRLSFLAHLPLTVHIVVEEGHGTKLLPSGELRLDCRASAAAVQGLIETACLDSLTLSAQHKVLSDNVDELAQTVVARLGLVSVEAGVGVDLKDMETCLFRMKKHILTAETEHTKSNSGKPKASVTNDSDKSKGNAKKTAASKLSALAGMRVRIGKYLGIADDGCVTWPHDFADI